MWPILESATTGSMQNKIWGTKIDIKKKLFEILEVSAEHNKTAIYVNNFIIALILINVLAVILNAEATLHQRYSRQFDAIELVSVILFTIEYILRLYVCTLNKRYQGGLAGRIKYIFSFYALIDLMAILPFYLPRIIRLDLRFLRIIRLLRIFRVLKLTRYSSSLQMIGIVVKNKKEEIVIVIGIVALLIVCSSCLMYAMENSAQPDKFTSILSTMWWSIATISTVGYGDVYPITGLGKVLASIIALLGIGLFALPTAILGSGFIEEFNRRKESVKKCPHCGREL